MRAWIVLAVAAAVGQSVTVSSQQPADPIMGILSQPNVHGWKNECGEYVQQTYVDWLAAAGVRAVPVHYNSEPGALRALLAQLNGVLFTGGGLSFQQQPQFYTTAQLIYNYTLGQNAAGNPFVLWGTCQGFQLIATIAAESNYSVLECDYVGMEPAMIPLDLAPNAMQSRFFSDLSTSSPLLQNDFTRLNTTANLHACGVQPASWNENAGLREQFTVISTNVDTHGKPFVSTYEHNTANIYGTQWHPEAAQFWYGQGLNKREETLRVSQYAANFLASKLRTTRGTFPAVVLKADGSAPDDTWLPTLMPQYPIVHNPAQEYVGFYCVAPNTPTRATLQAERNALFVVVAALAVAFLVALGCCVAGRRRAANYDEVKSAE